MVDECYCNESFRTAEDYRDHLPCRKASQQPHHNGLTPAQAEGLAILAEECGETTQRVGKILRHGLASKRPSTGESNVALLESEIGDILAICNVLEQLGVIDHFRVATASAEKLRKFREEHDGRLHHITVV